MIEIKYLKINKILAINNQLGVDRLLKNPNQIKRWTDENKVPVKKNSANNTVNYKKKQLNSHCFCH